jgi:hypothetical protein
MKNYWKKLNKFQIKMLCAPLTFWIILVVFWLVLILLTNMPNKGMAVVQTLIWAIILGIIVYYLCQMKQFGWAWFVVFLPLLFMVLMMLMVTMGMAIGIGMELGKNSTDIVNYYLKKSKK